MIEVITKGTKTLINDFPFLTNIMGNIKEQYLARLSFTSHNLHIIKVPKINF